ncbi:hypothetical protein BDU57DRAFT_548574 [Ampelomyces quisqualis]|uniref:CYTH domain-containing protein n=1 Tax=Ampelomyces quisqualis TaxID=50730 RepID=A0A6A5QMH7_AMPQU|nr:hypothetical protein BDU57DRAFT_548574 [Ampelomyces quisqualis]
MTPLKRAFAQTRIYQHAASIITKPGFSLEVERKFVPTPASLVRLRKNNGDPPFHSHTYLGRKVLKEFYLQHRSIDLMSHGIYLRVRNGVYEAKVRRAGNRTNTTSHELVGEKEVGGFIATAFPHAALRLEDMLPCCWMRTLRDEWKVDGFNVAVDHTLFGHWKTGRPAYPQLPHLVAEVELCRAGNSEDEGAELDRGIETFMEKNEWAFPSTEKAVGKLVAWERWSERGAMDEKRMEGEWK